MQVAITCRHGSISSSAQEYMSKKAEKLLTYFDRVTSISITIDFSNGQSKVEILVDAEHRHDLVAAETDSEATTAFDLALHKMEQQLRKYKEKIQDHKRGPGLSELPLKSADED
ncbi:MAG: ribosome-associated translation inhibitor RaiA [Planctomycetes bacterium]|nr:ribosome-associated translation inhibitor RaiA [Planctomycetota bacterium]